jgi:hypothetical protein
MSALPKPGDKVKWGTTQGETHGTVEKIVTTTTQVQGHTAQATKDHPEVMVKSDKSGKKAVHRPEALKKV